MARTKDDLEPDFEDPKIIRFNPEKELKQLDFNDEDEGGEGGEGGTTTGPLIDPAIFGLVNHNFLELIREFERKFSEGWVPVTKEPPKEGQKGGYKAGPPPHPLLSQSSQFSGDDRKINANPTMSEPGEENYQELRPSLQPSPTPTQQHVAQPGSSVPRPSPLGR